MFPLSIRTNLRFYCIHRYVDLLVGNAYLVDFVDTILRDERISLNDPIIMSFMEIYLPKVSKSRLINIYQFYTNS